MNATVPSETRGAVRPSAQSDAVWVVVAAYNEGERLGRTLQSLCRRCANVSSIN